MNDKAIQQLERVMEQAQSGEPGAKCPRYPDDACRVPDWMYEMQSIHPRMYGACEYCRTIYVVILPRRRSHASEGAAHFDYVLSHWETVLGSSAVTIVADAGEQAMMRSGVAQRLWMLASEHPMAIPREILHHIRLEAGREVRAYRDRVDALCRDLWNRLGECDEKMRALSTRGARKTALRALEAAKAIKARMAVDRQEAQALRATVNAIKADITGAREAARRGPLPIPADYAAPVIDPRSLLCDSVSPSEVIYALVDPADPELVRYVGRTCDPTARYRMHCTNGSEAVTGWAKQIIADGRNPAMVLLERCAADVVESRERYWIHYYRDRFQADLNRSIPRMAVA